MPASLTGSGWAYQCRIVDIRTLPTEQFLASPHLEDNVLAVLTRLADSRATIRQILERISTATPEQRTAAIDELLLLAGLRQLRVTMKKELERMSVLIDINRHTIFGPMYREAIQQGALEAERRLALRLLTKRFGKLPSASARRIRSMDSAELETLTLRLLDAGSLSDILA
jgi:hypothetical protein